MGFSCGRNDRGQLGIGDTNENICKTPRKIIMPQGVLIINAHCDSSYTLFGTNKGTFVCGAYNSLTRKKKPIFINNPLTRKKIAFPDIQITTLL